MLMSLPRFDQRWLLLLANRHNMGAAFRKGTTNRWFQKIRGLAVNRYQAFLALDSDLGDRIEKAPGVRVARLIENIARLAFLDNFTGIHDPDAVAQVGYDAEIMGNQD